jgi:23S rRNA (adenine2503-C2)-methyltransferase
MPSNLYNPENNKQLRHELSLDAQRVRQLRNDLLKRFKPDAEVLKRFPTAKQLSLHTLEPVSRHDSDIDGASKLILRTEKGMLIESVILRIATGRTTLCVSSQVGCAAACEFCATGKMGIAQNLASDEILDQVFQAGQLLAAEDRRLRNIVFMGMGEPFHNEENLYRTLEALSAAELFHHSPAKILVSTVGISEAMVRCARRFPKVNIALSLHSVEQEVRERLVPLARQYPLDQLHATLVQLNSIQKKPVMIEYLMLAGVNDSADDAQALAEWLFGLDVHVNLIPYNPIDDAPQLSATPRAERDAFAGVLKRFGLSTTIRYSLGADIAAAGGQLVRRENRARHRDGDG